MSDSPPVSGFDRIQQAYELRDARQPFSDWQRNIYHPRNPLGRLWHEHNRHILLRALDALDLPVPDLRILDVGCGYGYWLRFLVELGADPNRLTGLDLSAPRLEQARRMNPAIQWFSYEGGPFPVPAAAFDLVMQSVVFSSIPDPRMRRELAGLMLDACRPGGHILWLDLVRTANAELAAFQKEDVLALFPGCRIVLTDRAHPAWFRTQYRRLGPLCHALYALTRRGVAIHWVVLGGAAAGLLQALAASSL